MERPYWHDGAIEYQIPKSFPLLRKTANKWSRLLYLLTTRIDKLLAPPPGRDALVQEIITEGQNHSDFAEAVRTTDQIMSRVTDCAGPIPIVLFESGTTASPFLPAIKGIAARHGMHFVEALPRAVDIEEGKGRRLYSSDGVHWNSAGHRLVAGVLARFIRENNLVQPLPQ